MIELNAAQTFLDFGRRIGDEHRAREQLEGAVALHAMLETHGVAYLADEVGMGKTYVALGVLALYRHIDPDFRVAVIAPQENIQRKWQKELKNFVAHNVRYADLAVRSLDGFPGRLLGHCGSLLDFVRDTGVDPDRDYFLRMSSFSLALGKDSSEWSVLRDRLRREIPWLTAHAFDLRDKASFKDRIACGICAALPEFDLLIVDEAHHLKHGFGAHVAARNRTMGLVFGHPRPGMDVRDFTGYGRKAKRVLFLSATPIDDDYRQLHGQLEVFGRGDQFARLADLAASDDEKKAEVQKFLIRRVTTMQVGGTTLTKNQYRREWRHGGMHTFDDPLRISDERERLVVALMQKKVSDLLGLERFGSQFQIGMLASFESFLETTNTVAKSRHVVEELSEETANFDDGEQTENAEARRGIDVAAVNGVAHDYRERFGQELPHPKMNALVADLSRAWSTGTKGLVFVRRVRSVIELKRRLDDSYDQWLINRLRGELSNTVHERLDDTYRRYQQRKASARKEGRDDLLGKVEAKRDDEGDVDTFFAYFFRGDGPSGVVSGATIQRYFTQEASVYANFFEDNHVAWLLAVRPGEVVDALAIVLSRSRDDTERDVDQGAQWFLSNAASVKRGAAFEAAQAAAVKLLTGVEGTLGEMARVVYSERYEASRKTTPRRSFESDVAVWLERPTFFSELRPRAALRDALWPESKERDFALAFRENEQRAECLSVAARLGHALIDLFILAVQELGTLEAGARRARDPEHEEADRQRIDTYLDRLAQQACTPLSERCFSAFDELAAVAAHFQLLLDVNLPDVRSTSLGTRRRMFTDMLRRQQPVGGVSGGSNNPTLTRQFRMPGYPFILIATDVLQEGEDLHTFCSRVYHYGISWTPSSMEQRTGRIDRVRSQTDRHLASLNRVLQDDDRLQVYFPHLTDTVESLQVRRVLRRMDRFLHLMHEGLAASGGDERTVDVDRAIFEDAQYPEPIAKQLRTAFGIPGWALEGNLRVLGRTADEADDARTRWRELMHHELGDLHVQWHPYTEGEPLMGTAQLDGRVQPFALLLSSVSTHLRIRCISPVGEVGPEGDALEEIKRVASTLDAPVAAVLGREGTSYDLTVEDDVLLGDRLHDAARVGVLVRRVTRAADALEIELLRDRDQHLAAFSHDLKREGPANG